MAYCSPKAKENYKEYKTCFSKSALINLANSWNDTHPDKIAHLNRLSVKSLWNEINTKMSKSGACNDKDVKDLKDNSKKEGCWVDKLGKVSKEVTSHLTPKKPVEWKKDPRTWLTNYDIDDVLKQYEEDTTNNYKYMGAFPIDFAKPTNTFGACLYNEMCSIDLQKLITNKKNLIGVVFNTDPSDKPGQHWISLIICINPKLPSFGAYFQDSAGGPPPKEVDTFMKSMKKQADTIGSKFTFRLDNHKKRMQYKNTECGVYSVAYQLRWINLMKSNPNTVLEDVIKITIDDDNVNKARDVLYRD